MGEELKATRLMRDFWDEKARENVTYYISSYRDYHDQDLDDFWKWGRILTDRYLGESGFEFTGQESVLEVGCGIGRMTRPLATRFKSVHGIDVSCEMIDRARVNLEEYSNAEVSVGNGIDLGAFETASFDFVFSYITLQHIPEKKISLTYIREFGRVLKPGGFAYFQVNNLHEGLRAKLRLRTRLAGLFKGRRGKAGDADQKDGPKGLDHPAWTGSRIDLGMLRATCKDAGLKILRLTGQGTQYLWVKAEKTSGP